VTGRALSAVLEAACDVMTDLAIYPLALDADTGGAHVLAVMGSRALLTRSRGPYAADNLPPEALSTAESIQLRLSMQAERPEFTVEGGGPWPRLVMVLPSRGVLVRYVVPEEAPPIYQPTPNNATLSGDIKLAIRFVARSLQVASPATRRHGAAGHDCPEPPRRPGLRREDRHDAAGVPRVRGADHPDRRAPPRALQQRTARSPRHRPAVGRLLRSDAASVGR
jgi:hypothetical protein